MIEQFWWVSVKRIENVSDCGRRGAGGCGNFVKTYSAVLIGGDGMASVGMRQRFTKPCAALFSRPEEEFLHARSQR